VLSSAQYAVNFLKTSEAHRYVFDQKRQTEHPAAWRTLDMISPLEYREAASGREKMMIYLSGQEK
jgi:hypothetical protein